MSGPNKQSKPANVPNFQGYCQEISKQVDSCGLYLNRDFRIGNTEFCTSSQGVVEASFNNGYSGVTPNPTSCFTQLVSNSSNSNSNPNSNQ